MKIFINFGLLFAAFAISLTSCTSQTQAPQEETTTQEQPAEANPDVLPQDQSPSNTGETPETEQNQDVIESNESEVMDQ